MPISHDVNEIVEISIFYKVNKIQFSWNHRWGYWRLNVANEWRKVNLFLLRLKLLHSQLKLFRLQKWFHLFKKISTFIPLQQKRHLCLDKLSSLQISKILHGLRGFTNCKHYLLIGTYSWAWCTSSYNNLFPIKLLYQYISSSLRSVTHSFIIK